MSDVLQRASVCTGHMDFETRLAHDDAGTFTGYAARFGELNAHKELIKPGAFAQSIAEHQKRGIVPLLWGHKPR